jgi:hypothetical protein
VDEADRRAQRDVTQHGLPDFYPFVLSVAAVRKLTWCTGW